MSKKRKWLSVGVVLLSLLVIKAFFFPGKSILPIRISEYRDSDW